MYLTLTLGKKGILVDLHCTSPVVSYVEPVRVELVVDILSRLHFPAIRFSIAPSFPRRGPGFQLWTLSFFFEQ